MDFLNFGRRPAGKRQSASPLQRGLSLRTAWSVLLPVSIAAISGAILLSGGDPEQRPFLIFAGGVLAGVVGLLSLFVNLIQAGNEERARRAERERQRQAGIREAATGPKS